MLSVQVERLIELALSEDLNAGDATTDSIFEGTEQSRAELLAKSPLVLCGSRIFTAVMRRVDPSIEVTWHVADGTFVEPRTTLGSIAGPTAAILKAERTALNFLQRMSGVATQAKTYADALRGTETSIVDTRKTLPGWRALDKEAVRCGGGRNHRYNLGSGIMIKDNHIAAAGSIAGAIARVKSVAAHTLRIEVEVENFTQLQEAVEHGADIILLDNMDNPTIAEAVVLAKQWAGARPILLEASGGVTLERLPSLAKTGVDIISSGALTHSAIAADISLNFLSAAGERKAGS